MVEQKAGTPEQLAIREANMGIYCFRADLFWKHVDEIQPNNPAREYYLTDMAAILTRAGHTRGGHAASTTPAKRSASTIARNSPRWTPSSATASAAQLMLAGVTIDEAGNHHDRFRRRDRHGHDRRAVRADSRQDHDRRELPHRRLLHRSGFRAGRRRWKSAPFTVVNTSTLERGAHAGPFARLRMDNHVEAGAHIGNFVELKKTRMRAGAKASHLAYLGDSDIGAKVNIGAGTITCNYDGFKKHPTQIGEGAFVGSNSTLVAPIEIGAGAYVAAGSVITQAVPPDALAIGRGQTGEQAGMGAEAAQPGQDR